MIAVREEQPGDVAAVRGVVHRAFGQPDEANLVERIHRAAAATVSLVAVQRAPHDETGVGPIVGHILFSPVVIVGSPSITAVGLAPMAVEPSYQRRGIGTTLVTAGLDSCRALDIAAVVVLGHPDYYPRFGFQPAHHFGLSCEYDVPPAVFMALELHTGALADARGVARYHEAFSSL